MQMWGLLKKTGFERRYLYTGGSVEQKLLTLSNISPSSHDLARYVLPFNLSYPFRRPIPPYVKRLTWELQRYQTCWIQAVMVQDVSAETCRIDSGYLPRIVPTINSPVMTSLSYWSFSLTGRVSLCLADVRDSWTWVRHGTKNDVVQNSIPAFPSRGCFLFFNNEHGK